MKFRLVVINYKLRDDKFKAIKEVLGVLFIDC